MGAMLDVKGLMVYYENALAVNNVSLFIAKGEIVGVLGSNAAGKSTLMHSLSGLIYRIKEIEDRSGGVRIAVYGKIEFEGTDITDEIVTRRVKRGIVLTRERHPIFKDFNVRENLQVAAYTRKKLTRQDFDQVYTIFPHLKEIEKRKAGLMSGGEQQALCMSMALMAKPRLMLLDEPLLGLSPILQVELVQAIKRTRDVGVTILVTEQFARPLLPIIDRGYVIENGIMITTGTGRELSENPEVKAAYFGV
ncbi:MAG: ABC transporter ATP-binding protein [Dehalococcoidia bacterium]|jgi:branched-chain amino acid transport system ATP-binding protein